MLTRPQRRAVLVGTCLSVELGENAPKVNSMTATDIEIRSFGESDLGWAVPLLERDFGSSKVAACGEIVDAAELPGMVALNGDEPLGLATYRLEDDDCELVMLNSVVQGVGAGTALIEAVATAATAMGCGRLWLVTTNDNLHALGFFQKRRFEIAAVHPSALNRSRTLKDIPLIGNDGIPIRDEIELQLRL